MAAKELYDSYPLPDDGVDLEDGEHGDASALLLAYNTDAKTLRTTVEYLRSVIAGTAEESPLLYRDIGKMRGGWHAAPGGGFQSREFRFSGYDMRWHAERRHADAMATAVFVRNYEAARPDGLAVVTEEEEDKVASPPRRGFMHASALPPVTFVHPEGPARGPARTSAPPPPSLVDADSYARFVGLHSKPAVAKAPPPAVEPNRPDNPCYMRIADLLLNTHEPGYVLAAFTCAACGRTVARHDQ